MICPNKSLDLTNDNYLSINNICNNMFDTEINTNFTIQWW